MGLRRGATRPPAFGKGADPPSLKRCPPRRIVRIFERRSSMERRKHLEENAAALQIRLTPEDLRRIDEVAPRGVAAGERYPATAMRAVNR